MRAAFLAVVLALGLLAVTAEELPASDVQVADFEDVPTLQSGFVLPTRDGFAYAGLIWNGFYVINSDHGITKQFPRGGYRTGKVSGRFAGVGSLRNAAHTEIYPDTELRFDVLSLYITSAWRNGLLVRLEGLRGGKPVVHEDLTLQAGERQRLELAFHDLDVLRISAAGGEDAGLCEGPSCSPGPEVVFDDIAFRIRAKPPPVETSPVEITEVREPPEPERESKTTPEAAPPPEPERESPPVKLAKSSPPEPKKPAPKGSSPPKAAPPAPKPARVDAAARRRRMENQIASGVCGAERYYGAQVGAFSSKANALAIAAKLRADDTLVQIHEKSRRDKGPLYFVIAGCFEEQVHAAKLAKSLQGVGMDCYVTPASIQSLGPLTEE